jgi:branched-subunit amino acid ABC-type transport system permease component
MLARHVALQDLAMPLQIALTLGIVVPMGPMIYRVAYQPLAQASVLVLLIVSVGVHLAMVGLGLLMFGPEGAHPALHRAQFNLGESPVSGQSVIVLVTVAADRRLYLFFERTLTGKACAPPPSTGSARGWWGGHQPGRQAVLRLAAGHRRAVRHPDRALTTSTTTPAS